MRAWCVASLLAAVCCYGETRQERGKRIVEEVIATLGGDRFLAMKDRVESGRVYSFYHGQLRALARATIYTRYLTRPDPPVPGKLYVRERQAFGKDEDYAVLFDEEKGWQITFRGARPIPQETFDRYQDTTLRNLFYILRQRLGEPGFIIEFRGTDIFDNQPVELVDITDGENNVVTIYVHQSTRLPVRQVFARRDPKTRQRHEEVTLFAKYRDVGGGVQWPFNITRKRDGERIFEIFSESVVINQDLSDQLFSLTADLKILPPAR